MYVNFNRALTKAQIEALGEAHQATNGKIYFATDDGVYVGNADGSVSLKANSGGDITSEPLSTIEDPTNAYYTKTQTDTLLSGKQPTLVSGTNIKTVNNNSLLGSGNITIDPNNTFIARYNVTSFAAVKAAYLAGKTVVCLYLSNASGDGADSYLSLYNYFTDDGPGYESFLFAGIINNVSFNVSLYEDGDSWEQDNKTLAYQSDMNNRVPYYNGSYQSVKLYGGYPLGNGSLTLYGGRANANGSLTMGYAYNNTNTTNNSIQTNGTGSFAGGYSGQNSGIVASGYGSIAFGSNGKVSTKIQATGDGATAIGVTSIIIDGVTYMGKLSATGPGAHAEGCASQAAGPASHTEGIRTSTDVNALAAHAEGYLSGANSNYSHAEGNHTVTTNESEHAEGKYNQSNTNTISSIGIGTADNDRKNAFEVMSTGDVYIKGVGTYNGTNPVSGTNDVKSIIDSKAPLASPALTGTPTAPTATVGTNTTQIATTAFVKTAIDELPEPMIFKGSLGTGGIITTLPAASSSNEGYTYKVITAGTYAGQVAKVGDTFISTGTEWVLIPSGDEPSGTVTSVDISNGGGLSVSGSPITSSGTITIGHSNSVTAQNTQALYPIKIDAQGHISAYGSAVTLTNHSKLADATSADKVMGSTGNGTYEWKNISSLSVSNADTVDGLHMLDQSYAYLGYLALTIGCVNAVVNTGLTEAEIFALTGNLYGKLYLASDTGKYYRRKNTQITASADNWRDDTTVVTESLALPNQLTTEEEVYIKINTGKPYFNKLPKFFVEASYDNVNGSTSITGFCRQQNNFEIISCSYDGNNLLGIYQLSGNTDIYYFKFRRFTSSYGAGNNYNIILRIYYNFGTDPTIEFIDKNHADYDTVSGYTYKVVPTYGFNYAVNIYENGTLLSSKYLGKYDKAADADKLDGKDSTSYVSYANAQNNSVTIGTRTGTIAQRSLTVGYNNTASATDTLAIGYATQATGQGAFAGGYTTVSYGIQATGTGSFAFGYNAKSGKQIKASGTGSIAIGSTALDTVEATGNYSIAIGSNNHATNAHTYAIGWGNTASTSGAVAIGCGATASGENAISISGYATAIGSKSIGGRATGQFAISIGNGVWATKDNSVAIGRFNKYDSNTQFSIGNGTADNARSNILEITSDKFYVKGIGTYDGTNPTSGTNDLGSVIANSNNVFVIIPSTTTWQEAYNAYSAGKLVYYQYALCEYISIDGENNIEEACFSGIISDGEQAVVYHFDNKEISSVISYQSPSHIYDINPEQVITYKQSTNELPKYEASQAEIDALFSGGGDGGSS